MFSSNRFLQATAGELALAIRRSDLPATSHTLPRSLMSVPLRLPARAFLAVHTHTAPPSSSRSLTCRPPCWPASATRRTRTRERCPAEQNSIRDHVRGVAYLAIGDPDCGGRFLPDAASCPARRLRAITEASTPRARCTRRWRLPSAWARLAQAAVGKGVLLNARAITFSNIQA